MKAHLSRVAVTGLDQVLTSASNFAISIAIASTSSSSVFGSFALLYSIYWLCAGLARVAFGESTLSSRHAAPARGANGAPIFFAAVLGTIGLLVGQVVGSASHSEIISIGALFIPVLVAQDSSRFTAFAAKLPVRATISDALMLGAQILLGLVLTIAFPSLGAVGWVLGWGVGASLGLVWILVLGRYVLSLNAVKQWLRTHRNLAWNTGLEFAVSSGAQQVIVFAVPLVASLSALGALKAAQTAVGPLNVALSSVGLIILPALFAPTRTSRRSQITVWLVACISIAALALVYGVVLGLLPGSFLESAFGASWANGRFLVALVVSQIVAMGFTQFGGYVLRARGRSDLNVRLRVCLLPVILGAPIFGAATAGAFGAAVGLLIGSIAGALTWSIAVATVPARGMP